MCIRDSNEYRKYIEKDAALERRFQPVTVGEPSPEATLEILKGLRDKYEAHHRLTITDEALEAAVALSRRYINDRFLPDKAIDLMDEAASQVRMAAESASPDLKDLEEKIAALHREKEEACLLYTSQQQLFLRQIVAEEVLFAGGGHALRHGVGPDDAALEPLRLAEYAPSRQDLVPGGQLRIALAKSFKGQQLI